MEGVDIPEGHLSYLIRNDITIKRAVGMNADDLDDKHGIKIESADIYEELHISDVSTVNYEDEIEVKEEFEFAYQNENFEEMCTVDVRSKVIGEVEEKNIKLKDGHPEIKEENIDVTIDHVDEECIGVENELIEGEDEQTKLKGENIEVNNEIIHENEVNADTSQREFSIAAVEVHALSPNEDLATISQKTSEPAMRFSVLQQSQVNNINCNQMKIVRLDHIRSDGVAKENNRKSPRSTKKGGVCTEDSTNLDRALANKMKSADTYSVIQLSKTKNKRSSIIDKLLLVEDNVLSSNKHLGVCTRFNSSFSKLLFNTETLPVVSNSILQLRRRNYNKCNKEDEVLGVVTNNSNLKSSPTKMSRTETYCMYCKSLQKNFSRHLFRRHANEPSVSEWLKIKGNDRQEKLQRLKILRIIRGKGNSMYNKMMMEQNKPITDLILSRSKKENTKSCVMCKNCCGIYKKNHFYRHVQRCILIEDFQTKKNLIYLEQYGTEPFPDKGLDENNKVSRSLQSTKVITGSKSSQNSYSSRTPLTDTDNCTKRVCFCKYCNTSQGNLARHLFREHANESSALECMGIKGNKESKLKRLKILNGIRCKASSIYNEMMIAQNKPISDILIARRSRKQESNTKSSLVMCKNCCGTYKRNSFLLHAQTCIPIQNGHAKKFLKEYTRKLTPCKTLDENKKVSKSFSTEVNSDGKSSHNSDSLPKLLSRNEWHTKKQSFCMYCKTLQYNFARHLFRKHATEPSVIECMEMKGKEKEEKLKRLGMLNSIRCKSNSVYNEMMLAQNKPISDLIIARRSRKQESISKSSLVMCRKCCGIYKRSSFYLHVKKCISIENGQSKKFSRHLKHYSRQFFHDKIFNKNDSGYMFKGLHFDQNAQRCSSNKNDQSEQCVLSSHSEHGTEINSVGRTIASQRHLTDLSSNKTNDLRVRCSGASSQDQSDNSVENWVPSALAIQKPESSRDSERLIDSHPISVDDKEDILLGTGGMDLVEAACSSGISLLVGPPCADGVENVSSDLTPENAGGFGGQKYSCEEVVPILSGLSFGLERNQVKQETSISDGEIFTSKNNYGSGDEGTNMVEISMCTYKSRDSKFENSTNNFRDKKKTTKNFCVFCKTLQSNITRHFYKKHPLEPSVLACQKINGSNEETEKIKLLKMLRTICLKGNRMYKEMVLAKKMPLHSLSTYRFSECNKSKDSSFMMCSNCGSLCKKKSFHQHFQVCVFLSKHRANADLKTYPMRPASYFKLNAPRFCKKNLNSSKNKTTTSDIIQLFDGVNKPIQTDCKPEKRKNCCFYCKKMQTKLKKHLLKNHLNETLVINLINSSGNNVEARRKRYAIVNKIRLLGNHFRNQMVLTNRKPRNHLLSVKRNIQSSGSTNTSLVVCKNCSGLYKRRYFYLHARNCALSLINKEESSNYQNKRNHSNNYLNQYAKELYPIKTLFSEERSKLVLSVMLHDDITKTVCSDPLIAHIADKYIEIDGKLNSNVKTQIRCAAKLLINCQKKDIRIKKFEDCFCEENVDILMSALKDLCGFNPLTKSATLKYYHKKIIWIIQNSCRILLEKAIEEKKEETRVRLTNFLSAFKIKWSSYIPGAKTQKKIVNYAAPTKNAILNNLEQAAGHTTHFKNKQNCDMGKMSENTDERNISSISGDNSCLNVKMKEDNFKGTQISDQDHRIKKSRISWSNAAKITVYSAFKGCIKNKCSPGLKRCRDLIEKEAVLAICSPTQVNTLVNNWIQGKSSIPEHICHKNERPLVKTVTPLTTSFKHPPLARNQDSNTPKRSQRIRDLKINSSSLLEEKLDSAIESSVECNDSSRNSCNKINTYKENNVNSEHLTMNNRFKEMNMIKKNVPLIEIAIGNSSELTENIVNEWNVIKNNDHTGSGQNKDTIVTQKKQEDLTGTCSVDECSDSEFLVQFENSSDSTEDEISEVSDLKTKRKNVRWSEEAKHIVYQEFKDLIIKKSRPGVSKCKALIDNEIFLTGRTPIQVNLLVDNWIRGKIKLPTISNSSDVFPSKNNDHQCKKLNENGTNIPKNANYLTPDQQKKVSSGKLSTVEGCVFENGEISKTILQNKHVSYVQEGSSSQINKPNCLNDSGFNISNESFPSISQSKVNINQGTKFEESQNFTESFEKERECREISVDKDRQPNTSSNWSKEDELSLQLKWLEKKKRRVWSLEAKEVVYTAFKDCIKNNTRPGLKRCRALIIRKPELADRTPMQVNVMVDNWLRGKCKIPAGVQRDDDSQVSDSCSGDENNLLMPTSQVSTRKRWSEEEKSLVIETFQDCIAKGVRPGLPKCQQLINKHVIFNERNPAQINTFIDNWLRGKTKVPNQYKHFFPKIG